MATNHLEFLSEKIQTVSAGYTEGVVLAQARYANYAEGVHNQQIKDLVVTPSSSEEVLSQILSSSSALRGAQAPIMPPTLPAV